MAAGSEKVKVPSVHSQPSVPASARAWAEARALAWTHRGRLAAGLTLTLVNRLSALVLPASTKWFVDDVVGKQQWDLLPTLAAVVAIATCVAAASSFAVSQVLGVAAQRAITEVRRAVHAHIIRLPIGDFAQMKTGMLTSRIMHDADGLRFLLGTGLVQIVGSVITAVVALGVLFYLNWSLTVVMLLVLTLFGAGMAWSFTRVRPIYRDRAELAGEMTGRLNETLGGIRIVKAYAAETREIAAFARDAQRLLENVSKSLTAMSAVAAFSMAMLGATVVVVLLVGGAAVRDATMTIGDVTMYVSFLAFLTLPIVQMASAGTQLGEALASLDRIRDTRERSTEGEDDSSRAPLTELRGDVAFEDVSFEYSAGSPVLRHVSFDAPAGSVTALVGSSGAGKSTLIGLAMAFSRPTSGRILVDGRDLSAIRLSDYRHYLGVVLQDDFLFDGTIAESIAYGAPGASRAAIVEAGRAAHCHEFVTRLDAGYDTLVGERGVRLSGGQRQRVAIARALLADPRILILDEATSSLDSESEALIRDALATLLRGRTTFVIAHRLSTVQNADRILVLERGEIVQRGTHEELLGGPGRYRELFESQLLFDAVSQGDG